MKKYTFYINRTLYPKQNAYLVTVVLLMVIMVLLNTIMPHLKLLWYGVGSVTAIILVFMMMRYAQSYNLQIESENLSCYENGNLKWKIEIKKIKSIEEFINQPYGNSPETKYFSRPNTGVRITSVDNQNYEATYGQRLLDYPDLVQNLKSINQNIFVMANPHLEDLKQHGIT